ncbi:cation transporter [Pedobacter sp. P351]|uniref:cation transporter n=1 Tax=Pedobacter superstes TaxID=3133441 RepID=UPI0030968C9A
MDEQEKTLYKRAYAFALFIVIYNVIEGLVSMVLGYKDESLTLFGFGVDSFIEVASNLGVIYMIKRIQQNLHSSRTPFETTALKITGYGFYLLSVGLAIGIVENILQKGRPQDTFWGIVIALLSIGVMYYVAHSQIKTGKALNSSPIIADAKCTMVCIYMSIILLASSFIYELTGFGYIDSIGAAGLIYFSVSEGREALEKAKGKECGDCC